MRVSAAARPMEKVIIIVAVPQLALFGVCS